MKWKYGKILGGALLAGLVLVFLFFLLYNDKKAVDMKRMPMSQNLISLPEPDRVSRFSVEEALSKRRSVRAYKDEPLAIEEVSQILWAAQGITAPGSGGRTAPSAGALYPLEIYLAVKNVEGLEKGLYRYLPESHQLVNVFQGDVGGQLARAALGQDFIAKAPANLIFSGVFSRTIARYGERGLQYVYMEAGHAGQNVYLQAESLGLGTVAVGAFNDEEVKQILKMSAEETPLYIMPLGKRGR